MYCKVCGKNIEDDSKFCRFCGTRTSGIADNNRTIYERGGTGTLTTQDGKTYVVTGSNIYG